MSFQKIDEYLWYDTIVRYLTNGTLLDNKKILKFVQDKKNHFKIKRYNNGQTLVVLKDRRLQGSLAQI